MLPKLDIEFLKSKGFFKKSKEDNYGILDVENKLLYVVTADKESIRKIIREISNTDLSYVWFFNPNTNTVYVYRNYGEVKWFTFNPNFKRTDYIKSKEDKIGRISRENLDVLFDIKDIVENFYKELWKIRIKMAKSIEKLNEDINKLLVAQKFIDRLIFTYFLAQLNVLTASVDGKGQYKLNKESVRRFFDWLSKELKEDKLFSILNSVFFDVFGKSENEKNYTCFNVGDYKIKFEGPFLDGNIFREAEIENVKERDIEITKGIKDLIDLLNSYNWIVGESLPEDEDVISVLSPEILGHVYEKFVLFLEKLPDLKKIRIDKLNVTQKEFRLGKKKMGVYYTPEEITTYICKNTIEPYLLDKFNGKYKNVEELLNSNSMEDKRKAVEILKNIKVCDNACGSGAFLVKAAEILYNLRKKLGDNTEDYQIKKEIITNNLYGVDIMEGAVEIARLRLWLWLISSSDIEIKTQPLPNLEFNIMCGNSLIGYVEIPLKWGATLLDTPEKLKKLLNERIKAIKKYKQIHNPKEANEIKKEIDEIGQKIREELNKRLFNEIKAKGVDIKYEEFLELKPFHWGFEFYDVFSLDKQKEERGFDIIIGNPPYINNKKIIHLEKQIHPILYESCFGQYDYLVLFIENGIKILNNFGIFGYITSNKFLASEYGIVIRKILFESVSLTKIIDVSNFRVFRSISVYPILLFFKKKSLGDYWLTIGLANEGDIERNRIKESKIKKSELLDICKDYVISTAINFENIEIMKFLSKFEKLPKDCIYCGIAKSGFGKKIKSYKDLKKDELKNAKIILQSKDIDRFFISYKDKYVLPSVTSKEQWSSFDSKKIVIAGVGLYIRASYDKKRSALGRVYYIPLNLIENKLKFNPLALLSLLNSKLLNFYFSTLYNSVHQSGGYLRYNAPYLSSLPILKPNCQQPYEFLCDYMLFLNETEERRNSEKNLIEFIDREIIDSLVYELYFKEKFEEDGLKTNLIGLVEKYLKDIRNSKSDEEKLRLIKKVVENIKKDKELMEEIRKIKSHKWVRIIEESF